MITCPECNAEIMDTLERHLVFFEKDGEVLNNQAWEYTFEQIKIMKKFGKVAINQENYKIKDWYFNANRERVYCVVE